MPKTKPRILFLYTELAEYFLACIRKLLSLFDVEVHIVRWPVNRDAPFDFAIPEPVFIYEREAYDNTSLLVLVNEIEPDLIFCSGWVDKAYRNIGKTYKNRIPVIVGIDNFWHGNLKQQAARLLTSFTIHQWFSHAWVAGKPQHVYAKKIGFNENRILDGFYSADYDYFHSLFEKNRSRKQQTFPHRFLYVGRYIEKKGLKELWKAFIQLYEEDHIDWELWCIGTGPLEKTAPQHPGIRHIGFVQPEQMVEYCRETGVFVLPSHYEPWGVVVHEFSAAGFPQICSTSVGASTAFLKDGVNGYEFEPGNTDNLKECLRNIINMSDETLFKMGEQSAGMAAKITPERWSKTLIGLLQDKHEHVIKTEWGT